MTFSYALLLGAFFLAILQCSVPLVSLYYQRLNGLKWLKPISGLQFIVVTLAIISLAYAFLANDFTFAYVAQNSNTHLPWFYRVCALWGGHEGSILLWVFILNLWTIAVIVFNQSIALALLARVISVLGFISAAFLLFLLTLSNPFILATERCIDGRDLNPLLQDPGLIFHPPLLYMGYVGFSVSFAFAIAALLSSRFDKQWAMWMRPWTLAAWCFLTWGIVSGSWWAYRVLGWGGWWFWDPVENASLLPWLAGTALIHSLMVVEKQALLKTWVILLAILTFALSLIGTFIVRSGILISVHAFAVDPWRGVFMLGLLVLVIGTALCIYAVKIHSFKQPIAHISLLSRTTLLILNNVLLSVVVFTVLLGTLYPLIIDVLGLGKLSVGAPYFNIVFTPFAILLLFFMGFSYLIPWKHNVPNDVLKKIVSILLSSFSLSIILIILFEQELQWQVLIGLGLAFWIILNTLQCLRVSIKKKLSLKHILKTQGAMLIAHLGVAMLAIGIILSSYYSLERNVRMRIGDSLSLGTYHFKLQQVYALQGPNYTGAVATIQVNNPHSKLLLRPQLRYYPITDVMISKPAIAAGVWRDLYVSLAEPLGKQTWALRFYYKPFVRWIWMGGLCMILGGLWAILSRRSQKIKS
ncbi:MAG: heme lyase CcmF/NrfE family subunit [Candidatus Aquirickettsiella sp.]